MPADGLPWLDRSEILTFEEIQRLSGSSPRWASSDLRLTGGEPLVRREFPSLVSMLRPIQGLRTLVTTNGYLLERDAEALVDGGSTDSTSRSTARADPFFKITRRDALRQVMRGLEAIASLPEVTRSR